jgi:hypothetical protein
MILKTVNQSWAISDEFKSRYGRVWSELDFEINPKLSNYAFRNDPMNTIVGTLILDRKRISVKYKQLLGAVSTMDHYAAELFFSKLSKTDTMEITIFNNTFQLRKHEINKLVETIRDSCETIMKSYKLGLYL